MKSAMRSAGGGTQENLPYVFFNRLWTQFGVTPANASRGQRPGGLTKPVCDGQLLRWSHGTQYGQLVGRLRVCVTHGLGFRAAGSGGALAGGRRCLVACSKPYARVISLPSLQARPKNVM